MYVFGPCSSQCVWGLYLVLVALIVCGFMFGPCSSHCVCLCLVLVAPIVYVGLYLILVSPIVC